MDETSFYSVAGWPAFSFRVISSLFFPRRYKRSGDLSTALMRPLSPFNPASELPVPVTC